VGWSPDLLHDTGWWQSPPWTYAVFAVVIYARAGTERLDVSEREIAGRRAIHLTVEV
jgi:hypothetical protein